MDRKDLLFAARTLLMGAVLTLAAVWFAGTVALAFGMGWKLLRLLTADSGG